MQKSCPKAGKHPHGACIKEFLRSLPAYTTNRFLWLLTSIGMIFAMIPNIYSPRLLQWYFRFAMAIFFSLFFMYWIWFPIEASKKHFNSSHGAFDLFYNGINLGTEKEASDAYCWVISVLFGAWVFYGYGKKSRPNELVRVSNSLLTDSC